jgi:prepilin-type N-terminal cleavage/methylation domain-containing protein
MRPRLRAAPRSGFTVVELLMVFVVGGIIAAITLPRVSRIVQTARLDKAAMIVAGDLESGFSLAARQRKPIRLTQTTSGGQIRYTLAVRSTGRPLLTRHLGYGTEFTVSSVTFTQPAIDFFPNGLASSALSVTVAAGPGARCVTMTRAGLVRVQSSACGA